MKELDKKMYFGTNADTMEAARSLRKKMTGQEELLWEKLRNKQVCNVRFRRQHPINIFIADFYCHEARLVVEIDGEIHLSNQEYDNGRTAELGKYDIKVIRFSNSEVEKNIENVIGKISKEIKGRIKSPPWGI